VRHILIIFSILLLGCVKNQTSTEFVQGTEFLYQYETSSGLIFKSFGDGKVQPKYKGEITNGKPNGFGVLTYPYGEKSVVGVWKNGKEWYTKHAKKDGTLIGKFENGEWIVSWGVLYMGFRNGKVGYYTEKWEGVVSKGNQDVAKYEGDIRNGKPNGQGTHTYPDGRKYVGEFKDGEYHGQGTYIWSDGRKYVGEYKDGKRWNGIMYDKNGNITGKYVNGLKVEKRRKVVLFEREVDGVLGWYENGDEREDTKFVGEIKNGKQNGEGTQTYPDGRKYVGGWKMVNGVKVEKGILFRDTPRSKWEEGGEKWFRTGDEKTQAIYEGEIVTGVPGGQGTITFPSGSTYVGEFRDGKRTGQGTMTILMEESIKGSGRMGNNMVKGHSLLLMEENG